MNNNDETTPMRNIAHSPSALADLFGWKKPIKPLSSGPTVVTGVAGPVVASAPEPAPQPPAPQPAPTQDAPRFGEMWRRNSDGMEVVVGATPDGDTVYYGDGRSLGYTEICRFIANYTRVTPKPGLNWRPIAEWDSRDTSRDHWLCMIRDLPRIQIAQNLKHASAARLASVATHFAEIQIPEGPK